MGRVSVTKRGLKGTEIQTAMQVFYNYYKSPLLAAVVPSFAGHGCGS